MAPVYAGGGAAAGGGESHEEQVGRDSIRVAPTGLVLLFCCFPRSALRFSWAIFRSSLRDGEPSLFDQPQKRTCSANEIVHCPAFIILLSVSSARCIYHTPYDEYIKKISKYLRSDCMSMRMASKRNPIQPGTAERSGLAPSSRLDDARV